MTGSVLPAQLAVLVGRFMPLHHAHLALLRQALDTAPHCVVIIGSAHQARSPRNPWTWQEREQMIRLALTEDEQARIRFVPLRDFYDEARWLAEVRRAVDPAGERPRVALVGHMRDATRGYLQAFADWQRLPPPVSEQSVDGAALRDLLMAAQDAAQADPPGSIDAALAAMAPYVPASTLGFLRAWVTLPFHAALAQEWRMLRDYRRAWSAAPYPPVFVTVDTVITCASHVLLIRRGQPPGRGLLAVPGGFIEARETAYQSALRELEEETGLRLLTSTMQDGLRAQAVFDHPDRSQRGRTITHAFHFDLGERELPQVQAADDALAAHWVPLAELAGLEDQFHDDHFHMLDHFLGLTSRAAL